ncbi:hypothetical protein TNCV_1521821 [Trichonephila clavipes]|nr:hypothetical protein TNCV_1521821 [Trichonephila clavipes]
MQEGWLFLNSAEHSIRLASFGKTPMETLKMLSKVCGNLPRRDSRFTNGIGGLKRIENPSKTMNTLDDLQLHGMQKM